MLAKIILIDAPVALLSGWAGNLIYRTTGLYKVKKVEKGLVTYYKYSEAIPPEDSECLTAASGFLIPVLFMPQLEADERYQELDLRDWAKAQYHIEKTPRKLFKRAGYKTHYVYAKQQNAVIRIGARSPIQRFDRSWPILCISLGW